MKFRKLFLGLSMLFAFGFLSTSCGDKNGGCIEIDCADNIEDQENLFVGNYSGTANLEVEISPTLKPSVPINANFTVSNDVAGDSIIKITSNVLDNYDFEIFGKIDPNNCKKILVDTVTIETLVFSNLPNSLASGVITNYKPLSISEFKATGNGIIECGNVLKMTIEIISGTLKSPNIVLNNRDVSGTVLEISVIK